MLLGVCAPLSPLGMFLVCVVKWMSLSEDSDSGLFPFKVRMAATRPILFSGLFCFVSLSWINTHRKRVIHFSGKTGYSKTLQVTTKQTCSHTIIFIKEPHSMRGGRLHGGAPLPSPLLALSPRPTCSFLWITVSSDGRSGNNRTEWAH